MSGQGTSFERLRPRAAAESGTVPQPRSAVADQDGKRLLFSAADQPLCLGAVAIDCGSCGRRSVVTAGRAVLLAVPSLHLPVLRRGHPSWMRCPACRRRTWVRLSLRH